jgi:hypothetical protein
MGAERLSRRSGAVLRWDMRSFAAARRASALWLSSFIALAAFALEATPARASAQAEAMDPAQGEAADVAPAPLPAASETAPGAIPPLEPETPPPDARRLPAPDARVSEGCGPLPASLGAALAWGGASALGGLTTCAGGLLASLEPGPSSGNCAEDCVEAAFVALVVVFGVVVAVTGILILGPVAAVAATIGGAVGAAGAGRQIWPSIVGGSVGSAVSLLGLTIAVLGFVDAPSLPYLAGTQPDFSDPRHVAMLGGVALSTAGAALAVLGVIVADSVLGGPEDSPRTVNGAR